MTNHITHDAIYNTVDRDDFAAMLDVHRYGERTDAFDGIISATHDLKMLQKSDRILWIEDGQIVKAAKPEELDFNSDEFH